MGDSFPFAFGRYQLLSRIAVGGMAEVFLAESPGEHGFAKRVVIKRLLPSLVGDQNFQTMFIDEAKLTARLVHPKIAQTFELGKVNDHLFIAMELVDGVDVLAMLREYAQRRRRVDAKIAVWICHEVLDALEYAHHARSEDGQPLGVVHRDISPSNILLSLRGDVKLVDFGIARQKDNSRAHHTKSGTLKGKYGYMSPEQVVEMPLDERSDVFSVGVVLAELLTGRRLFAAANELDVLLMVRDAKLSRFDKYGADVENGLKDIVRRSLRKNVEERLQTAGEFRDALSEWLFDQRIRITPGVIAEAVLELRGWLDVRSDSPDSAPVAKHDDENRAPRGTPPQPVVSDSQRTALRAGSAASGEVAVARTLTAQPAVSRAATMTKIQVPNKGSTKAPPAGIIPPADKPLAESSGELDLNLGSSSPEIELASPPETKPFSSAQGSQDALDLDGEGALGALEISSEPKPSVVALSRDNELSAKFPSIAAAVQSAVPMAPDPAMRDFDDLTIEPGRSTDVKLPSVEELARKKPPTPPALADIPEEPEDSGDFSATPAMRVLYRLMVARATGLLVVAVGGIKKEIYIRDGQPEYVSSNVASELFGNYLVSKGVLSDGELAMALAMVPHYGGKLGDTLVGLGLLKPLEVFRHLTRQVRSKIVDVCTWAKGGFGWYVNRENPREAFPLDFNTFEILGAGALSISDDVAEAWFAKHGSLRMIASRTRRVGPDRFEVKGLPELFAKFETRQLISDLVDGNAERMRTIKMLYLLDACELIRATV